MPGDWWARHVKDAGAEDQADDACSLGRAGTRCHADGIAARRLACDVGESLGQPPFRAPTRALVIWSWVRSPAHRCRRSADCRWPHRRRASKPSKWSSSKSEPSSSEHPATDSVDAQLPGCIDAGVALDRAVGEHEERLPVREVARVGRPRASFEKGPSGHLSSTSVCAARLPRRIGGGRPADNRTRCRWSALTNPVVMVTNSS